MGHEPLDIADIQYGSNDASKDKILLLGNVLKEIYQASCIGGFAIAHAL